MVYVKFDEIKLTEMFSGGTGLFVPARPGESLMVITRDSYGTYMIRLDGELRFKWFELAQGRGSMPGILFENPEIEIDIESIFRPNGNEEPGDLIVDGTSISIVCDPPTHRDGERANIPLWKTDIVSSTENIGFRKWRMKIGSDREVRYLWPKPE